MSEYLALVRRAQTGDVRAFNEVVYYFQNMAVGYAHSILGDFHRAEDAAQDAFLDVYRLLPQLEDPAAFPGWFRRIIFKHCDRFTRKAHLNTEPIDLAMDIPDDHTPADHMATAERKRFVLDAIQTLPEQERTVVTLYYVVEHDRATMAKPLVEHGADIDAANIRGARSIHWAMEFGMTSMTALLVELGAEYDMGVAGACGDTTFVREALARDPALATWTDANGFHAVTRTAQNGHMETVKIFLDYPIPFRNTRETMDTEPTYTTLSAAASNGHIDIVRLLLDHGADVDEVHYFRSGWEYVKDGVVVDVGSPLFLASQNGHLDVVGSPGSRRDTPC